MEEKKEEQSMLDCSIVETLRLIALLSKSRSERNVYPSLLFHAARAANTSLLKLIAPYSNSFSFIPTPLNGKFFREFPWSPLDRTQVWKEIENFLSHV